MQRRNVLVIGAANMDIKGRSSGAFSTGLKNPGRIEMSAGGVARNIAENLARIGVPTTLLTALGDPCYSQAIIERTTEAGVNLDHALLLDGRMPGIFMAVINHRGDLQFAVSDMRILDEITPEYLERKRALFKSSSFIIVDADIPLESIDLAVKWAREERVPMCIETVSAAKTSRIVPHLKDLFLIAPNREEAEVLVGFPLDNTESVVRAGEILIAGGLRRIIITLGGEGVFFCSSDERGFLSSIPTMVADSVGAGDALVAGVVQGILEECTFKDAVKRGIAAAVLTLKTDDAVNRDITKEEILKYFDKSHDIETLEGKGG
jgi:pseudouridine kinase